MNTTSDVFEVGERVRVISYGPFKGLKGTVQQLHTIPYDAAEPFCFYLVAVEGAYVKEPIWFEHEEVQLLASIEGNTL